jgi:hypothetical protein
MALSKIIDEPYYSAKQAREDYENKRNLKNLYTDQGKLDAIFLDIKKKIQNMNSEHSKSSSFPYPEYDAGYLSLGEQKFLKDLGYKVEYVDGGIQGDFWRITW